MTTPRSDLPPALDPNASVNDQEESVVDIIDEIVRGAGDDMGEMMVVDAGPENPMDAVPSPAPVFLKTTENCGPSSPRRSRPHDVPTKRLHNDVADRVASPRKTSENLRSSVYTLNNFICRQATKHTIPTASYNTCQFASR
jgi:hypothetical protein